MTDLTDRTDEVQALRDLLGGRIFGAKFVKRNGEIRTGSFRLGVRRDLTGKGLSYDSNARGNLVVWDMTNGAYRTIRLESVVQISARGVTISASDIIDDTPT